jgi:hypothetical protein
MLPTLTFVATSLDPTFAVAEGVTSAKGVPGLMEIYDGKLSTSVLYAGAPCTDFAPRTDFPSLFSPNS